jgi:hypothetical protein
MDAGAADFDCRAEQVREPGQVELALRIQAAKAASTMRRQDAVGTDHTLRVQIAHDQVVAPGVERVLFAAVGTVRGRTHLLDEHLVAQAQRILDVRTGARERHSQARGGCRRRVRLLFDRQGGSPSLSWHEARQQRCRVRVTPVTDG